MKKLMIPFLLFASLFGEEVNEIKKIVPKKLIVETKKISLMENIGFAYESESVGRFNYEETSLGNVLSGFSGNAYYSHPIWKGKKSQARVNMGGSLAMVGADVIDFEDLAGNSAGAQLGLKIENGSEDPLVTSIGVDVFQSVYDSKSRSSTGVRMHYGLKF